jgi:uncharacterized integral membrane protein
VDDDRTPQPEATPPPAEATPPPAEPTSTPTTAPRARTVHTGTGIVPAVIAGVLLALAIVVFVAQNSTRVELEWLWLDFRLSPAALFLGALLIGVVADEIAGLVWRRARRRRLDERDELQQLRRGSGTQTSPES